jgi:RNA polymerase sigma-70 factor (ECF subfamily)
VHPTRQRTAETAHLDTLLTNVAAGDHESFDVLYRAALPRAHAIAVRVLRNHALASEAVQEGFLDVWRLSATFEPARGTAITWIATIVHRRAVDLVRTEQAGARRDRAYAVAMYYPAHVDDPAATLLHRFEIAELLSAMDALSSVQRQAVELVYFSGLPVREIALSLGIPLPTLRTRLRDGIQRLRLSLRAA